MRYVVCFEKSVAINKQKKLIEYLSYYLAPFLLIVVDYIAIICAVISAKSIRNIVIVLWSGNNASILYIGDIYAYIIFPTVFILFIAYGDMYNKRMPFWQFAEILFKTCIYVNALVILITYLVGTSVIVSRLFMATLWILSFFYLCIFRQFSKKILHALNLWQRPVVIVGAGKTAEIIARTFENEPGIGYKIVGLVEDYYDERPLIQKYPHIGTFENLEKAIIDSKVNDVILATPGLEREKLISLMQRVQPYVRNLTIVPDLFGIPVANIEAERFIDDRLVMLKTKNNLELPINKIIKRLFDICVGSIIFVFVLPILFLLAVFIKYDSKGPIFHIARRIGRGQRNFSCYKFRTMHINSNTLLKDYLNQNEEAHKEWAEFAKLRTFDPRVTKVGNWMRKYSLDELPQIINVLQGNMSLVGPRPYLPRERKDMGYYINTICQTVPGITGLWQVSGRNEINFAGRLRLDAWYVRNWSIWQDIILLIKTIKVVFASKGAY
jgi:undecaprenyl-phosphate galactose phosphotransferase